MAAVTTNNKNNNNIHCFLSINAKQGHKSDMAAVQTNVYRRFGAHITCIACLLHVSTNLVAGLSAVRYRGHITKVFRSDART
jgi:hypothetical protein